MLENHQDEVTLAGVVPKAVLRVTSFALADAALTAKVSNTPAAKSASLLYDILADVLLLLLWLG